MLMHFMLKWFWFHIGTFKNWIKNVKADNTFPQGTKETHIRFRFTRVKAKPGNKIHVKSFETPKSNNTYLSEKTSDKY